MKLNANLEIKLADKIKAISFTWTKDAKCCEWLLISLWLFLLGSFVMQIVAVVNFGHVVASDYYIYLGYSWFCN